MLIWLRFHIESSNVGLRGVTDTPGRPGSDGLASWKNLGQMSRDTVPLNLGKMSRDTVPLKETYLPQPSQPRAKEVHYSFL